MPTASSLLSSEFFTTIRFSRAKRHALAALCALSCAGSAQNGAAQTINVLLSCDSTNAVSDAPLTKGPDGTLYGTTTQGRTYGTLFKMTPAGSLTTLHTFVNTDGSTPIGGLVFGTDGYLYGTTSLGGTNSDGTVFKTSTSGVFTSLYSFTGGADGSRPYGKLVQATDGNFYGVTLQGGGNACGAIYQITPAGTLTTMHQFNCGIEGGNPRDGLIQASDGNLYGTTSASGTGGRGSAFRMGLDGTFTVLHSFSPAEGNTPYAGLVQGSDGNFYGTAWQGGSSGNGTVFRMNPNGAVTTLHNFVGADGKNPAAALIQGSDGNLYGSTYSGGDAIYGTLFVMTIGGELTRLYSFKGSDGQFLGSSLVESPAGTFLGITPQGGFNNKGTVFSLAYTRPASLPAINAGGVVPLYSASPVIQSGSWVSIFGVNLAPTTVTWNGDFPQTLGGTSVTINGKPAYLWFVSPGQINLQAPNDTAIGPVAVVVKTQNGIATGSVTLAQASPSFSLLDSRHVAAIILRPNGTGANGGGTYDIAGPTGTSLGYPTVAARAGDNVVLFGVGFGPVSPAVPAGQAFSGAAATVNAVTVNFGAVSLMPAFSGLSAAGLYQLNITIPAGLGTGDVGISASVGGAVTSPGAVLSLQ